MLTSTFFLESSLMLSSLFCVVFAIWLSITSDDVFNKDSLFLITLGFILMIILA